jgi:hypothetical protein
MFRKSIFLTSFILLLGLVCNASGQPTGQILFEYWFNIDGTAVSNLTDVPAYPDCPDESELRDRLEGPVDWADNYGSRARGYLYPPADGDYTFWISGDDYEELYLSTDDDPANATLIAEVPGWTNHLEWGKYPEQQSVPITLVGGQKYYIESIMKEGGGGDSMTVAWTGPEIGEDTTIIDGAFLSPVIRMAAWGADPANGAIDVKAAPVLTWTAGETAFQYDLYLGTDADLVAAGDASVSRGSLSEASFAVDVNTPLSRGVTYYWKVDVLTGSARASELHPGNVWSFRVADNNTASWLEAASKDSPAYLDTFVEDGLYDIGTLGGEITYEFVVLSNPDEQEASMCLIGRRQFGDTQAGLKYEQWNNTGTYGATLFGVVDLDFGVPTAPGEYTHLTFVSSEATNTTTLYVNGALAGSVDSAITLSGLVGIGYGAQGEDMSGSFDNFDGTIFGVAIYDMALTDEQIAAHADSYFNPVKEIIPVNPGTEGLVAYYAFENDANDSSGNEIHGTLVGDAKFAEGPAGYGMALDLDGDGDYVDCGLNPLLDITEQITFTYWIKAVALDKGWNTVLSRGDDSWRSSRAGENNFMEAAVGGTSGNYLYGQTLVDDNNWHHVAAVYDGATFSIYVDGKLDGSEESTGLITVSSYPLYIGNNSQNTDREWTGLIDEVMIYNRALSDLEVMYLAGKRATPVDPGTDNLLAWWACDEGEGNIVGDASGNGHDGTFVNGDPVWVEGVQGTAVELVGPTLVEVPPLDMELTEATMAGWILPYGAQPDWSSIIMTRDPGLATGFNVLGYQLAYHWNDDSASWSFRGGDMIAEDDWTFAAVTVDPDKATFYVNGEKGSVNEITHEPCLWNSNIYLGGDGTESWLARRMVGALDNVYMYDRALSEGEIRYLAGFRAMDNPGTDNLIAAYAFENDVLDGSGNGNDATVNGDPVFVEGMVGMALEFDGSGDFLDCGANPILALTDAVSVSAWIKVAVAGADHKVGGNQDGANGGYKMSVYGDKIEFEIRTAANSAVLNRSVAGGTIIEVDTWYHVVGVYSLEDGYIRTYVNGELDRELLTTEALGASPGSLVIGAEPFNTGSYNFNGIMDEVCVYNKALSAAEARYLANN